MLSSSLGVGLPTVGAGASPDAIEAASETAAKLGWRDVWVSDHVLVPHAVAEQFGHVFEPLVTIAWVAARHPSLRVGIGVLILPMRNAVVVGKELATLDVLSSGRLNVGLGIGALRGEYRNLGAEERFSRRASYLEESIGLWRHLWSGAAPPFRGQYHRLDDYEFSPLPVQGADIPIWIGGRTPLAVARAGRLSDGYIAGSESSPELIAKRRRVLQLAADEAGRPVPRIAVRMALQPEDRANPRRGAERVRAFQSAGADQVIVGAGTTDPAGVAVALENLAAAL